MYWNCPSVWADDNLSKNLATFIQLEKLILWHLRIMALQMGEISLLPRPLNAVNRIIM